MKLSAAGN